MIAQLTPKAATPVGTTNEWSIPFTDEQLEQHKLFDIPGLRIDPARNYAVGSADAVGAACALLNAHPPTPKLRPALVQDLSKHSLRKYQEEGVVRLQSLLRTYGGAVLADDMGLGKTRQSITTAMLLSSGARVLILCPASVRETWREELAKCGVPENQIAMLGPPSSSKFKKAWAKASEVDWVVSSYDLADTVQERAVQFETFDFLILDEAHAVKGRKTKRAQAVEDLGRMCRYKLLLTGTPIWSRPRDLYRLLRIALGKSRFGTGYDFDLRYCGMMMGEYGGYEAKGATHSDELRDRLRYYMVRRLKEDVLDELPALTRQVMWVDASSAGQVAMRACFTKGMGSGNVQNALTATLGPKTEVAMQLASEARKFLLFTYRRRDAKSIAQKLNEAGTPCVCITGDITPEQRNAAGKLAMAKGWGVVATLDSLSVGVNLQGVGSIGIMHCLDYVPLKMLQAEARLHRFGQKEAVTWYYLAMRDSMDEVVTHQVVEKLDQWQAIMGKDAAGKLRDKLNAAVGVGEDAENEVLASIYEEMNATMGDDDDED